MLSYHATCSKVEVDKLKVTFQDSSLYSDVLEEAAVHVKPWLSWMVMLRLGAPPVDLVELSSLLLGS